MSATSTDQRSYVAAQFRELQEGRLDSEQESYASPHAGFARGVDLHILDRIELAFRGADDDPQGYEAYDDLTTVAANATATVAVREGDTSTLSNMTGLVDNAADVEGVSTMRYIAETIAQPAACTMMEGDMGAGKTEGSALLVELTLWGIMLREDIDERETYLTVLTNVESMAEQNGRMFEYVDAFTDLKERLDESPEDERILFVFDEGSGHASGYSEDAQDAVVLAKLVRLIRKSNGSMVIVGHSRDIHPAILRLCNLAIRKLSEQEAQNPQKEAGVFRRDVSRDGKERTKVVWKQVEQLDGIPASRYEFDTNEASSWTWDNSADKRQRLVNFLRLAYELDVREELTQTQISECVGCDRSYVSKVEGDVVAEATA
jgi:hypothetical protein